MKKIEIEQKLDEYSYRISKLEQRLLDLQSRNSILENEINMLKVEKIKDILDELNSYREKNNSVHQAFIKEIYEYVKCQKDNIIFYVDNMRDVLQKKYQELSDTLYEHIDKKVKIANDEIYDIIQKQNKEIWFRTFGYDKMISELQLLAIEKVSKGNKEKLEELRDTHIGESCFIIGNGPSLLAEDLSKIKQKRVFSFASKGIYNIFEETDWRPNLWAVSDLNYIDLKQKDISELDGFPKLVCAQAYIQKGIFFEDTIYYPFIQAERKPQFFNSDITQGVHFYGTITGKLINFAVYMGFKKIYLLGCDNSLPLKKDEEGRDILDLSKKLHFSKKYLSNGLEKKYVYKDIDDIRKSMEYVISSYEVIKYNCQLLGIEIYNATRGGELEVFERVNFDNIIENIG